MEDALASPPLKTSDSVPSYGSLKACVTNSTAELCGASLRCCAELETFQVTQDRACSIVSYSTYSAFKIYKNHFNAHRHDTDVILLNGLRALHPDHHVTTISPTFCDLLAYSEAGNAKAELDVSSDAYQAQRIYRATSGRSDESPGKLSDQVSFGKFHYVWKDKSFLVYVAQ